jgi:hypothetical protein
VTSLIAVMRPSAATVTVNSFVTDPYVPAVTPLAAIDGPG